MTSLKELKQLLNITKEFKRPLLRATLFGSLGHLTLVIFTYFLTLFFIAKITTVAAILFIIILALAILKGLFSYIEQLLNHYVAFKVLHVLRIKVMDKFKKISINSFTQNSSGDYMTMITTDIELLEVFYAHTITPFMIYIVQACVVSIFVMIFSVPLGILALVIYIIIGLIYPLTFKNKGQAVGDSYRRKLAEVNNHSSEEAYGIFETVQYDKIGETKKDLVSETEELTYSAYLKNKFLVDLNALNIVTYNFGVLAFIFAATKHINNPNIIITLSAMFIVSFIPILYMGNLASTLSQTMASGKRFLELMNTPEENVNDGVKVPFNTLTVKNLSYHYDDKTVFKDINFTVNKGEIIGISGPSGCGKSTIAKLIMKFIDNSKMGGNIIIDGVNVQDIDNAYFRKHSSIILQDSYLFNTSIKNNLTFFDKTINKNLIDKALKNTNLKNHVDSLRNKTDTTISERSANISSGQKQRLSVARSFYNESKLLILDEATANIDIFSEIEVLKALEKDKNDKITIIISHNKSTLSICDRVIKLGE
ncbi:MULTISPECIES: ABC transporter ATP-binding protein [Gemella]|uniref:ABC transporter ATP-binding protein n=1 Tax=Gemella TaxID=1378 RepID=UPI000767F835|nr:MULTISPECIES: ABC transporter ATP-binding protein [Gemella]AME08862.1 ABC transporter ATP-binding protein [Gemella sp. oral taxon 928]AXI26433.1 ABC transporter ATP-binding protein [Gemella sp. ND 6198]